MRFGDIPRRLGTLLAREGLRGALIRLLHPKRGGMGEGTPHLELPLKLVGIWTADLREAFMSILGQEGLCEDRTGGTVLHVDPDLHGFSPIPGDVVMFRTVSVGDNLGRLHCLVVCSAVLVSSGTCRDALAAAGLAPGRIFVLPAPDQPGLKGGLARWLVAAGALAPQTVKTEWFPALSTLKKGDALCLSLPEATARRTHFNRLGLSNFAVFDGIRLSPTWRAAGYSHAFIAQAAQERGAVPLTVCEDDLVLPEDFEARRAQVEAYLAQTNWDIFSGLLTNFPPEARIQAVQRGSDLTFVQLDFTIGMVFNIYGPRALQRLADWPSRNLENETIDVWLGRMPGLRVITTLPFLVGHDDTHASTVFGFSNRRYSLMIRQSERRLERRVLAFEAD